LVYDNFFKNVFTKTYDNPNLEIYIDKPLGQLPLKADIIIKIPNNLLGTLPIPLLSNLFSTNNIIEFKSAHDTTNETDLSKLIAYLGHYAFSNNISLNQMRTQLRIIYISAKRPKFIDNYIDNNYIQKENNNGLYILNLVNLCEFYIIIIDEIEINEDNLPLLFCSSAEALKRTIKTIVEKRIQLTEKNKNYLISSCYINYEEVKNMSELKVILPEELRRNIRSAINDIGLANVIKEIGIEEVIKAVGIKEVVDKVRIEEVIKEVGIKEVVDKVGIKEVIKEVGIKEVIKEVGIKEVVDKVGIKEVIKEVGIKEVINKVGIEEVLKEINPEEIKNYLKRKKIRKNKN